MMSSARLTQALAFSLMLILALAGFAVSGAAQEQQPPIQFDKLQQHGPFPPAPQGTHLEAFSVRAQEAAGVEDWTRIAYQSYRDGNWEIYFARGDGSAAINLTKHPNSDARPSINRGATRIAFNSNRDGNAEIYTMNVDGSGLKRLTSQTADDYAPTWSPDGNKIAFVSTRDGNEEIYSMNADGTNQTRLTYDPAEDTEPVWSPAGSKIAWGRYSEYVGSIWFMNPDGTGQSQFAANLVYMGRMAWKSDGRELMVDFDADNDFWNEIVIYNTSTGGPSIAYMDDSGESFVDYWAGSWSPDATWSGIGSSFLVSRVEYTVIDDELYIQNTWIERHTVDGQPAVRLPGAGLDLSADWQTGDITAPSSSFINLRDFSPAGGFLLEWTASDPGLAEISEYQVEYSIDLPDNWFSFHLNPLAQALWYQDDKPGQRLYLRVRAKDEALNVEDWPTSPAYDAVTTLYSWLVSGQVRDNHGLPVPKAGLSVLPAALNSVESSLRGTFQAWMGADLVSTLSAAHTGYASFPGLTITMSHDVDLDFYLPPLDNVVKDGSFEAGGDGWILNSFPYTDTGVSNLPHTGTKSLHLGPACTGHCLSDPVKFGGWDYEMITDPAGAVHVVYMAELSEMSALFYTVRSPDGNWSPAVVIHSFPAAYYVVDLSIAVDGKGNLFVVWQDVQELFYTMKQPAGSWSKPEVIARGLRPIAEGDPLDGFHLLYQEFEGNFPLQYRQRPASGAWSAPVMLSDSTRIDAADISVGPDRTVYALYYQTAEEEQGVYYRARLAGGSFSSPTLVPGFLGNPVSLNALQTAATPDGTLHALFNTSNVYYRNRSSSGVWSEPQLLSNEIKDAELSVSKSGTLFLNTTTFYLSDTTIQYLQSGAGWSNPVNLGMTRVPKLAIGLGEVIHMVHAWQDAGGESEWLYQTTLTGAEDSFYGASQVVTLTESLAYPTMAFYYYTTDIPGSTPDSLFQVSVTDEVAITQVYTGLSGGDWTFVSLPLDQWMGETITVTFKLEQEAGEPQIHLYLDDLSIGSWLTPSIASVSPPEIGTGWAGKVLTIEGENFIATPTVYLDNTALINVHWVDENSLQATLPPGLGPGLYSLLVKNPGGQENALPWSVRLGSSIYLPTVQR